MNNRDSQVRLTGERSLAWPRLSQMIIFCICVSSATYATANDADDLHASQPMTFHHGGAVQKFDYRDEQWIQADGIIEKGTLEALKAFLADRDHHPKLIRFNSPGGNLGEALELGRYIRANGFSTQVGKDIIVEEWGDLVYLSKSAPGRCISACAYSFFAGLSRTVDEGSSLGVHRFFVSDSRGQINEALFAPMLIDNTQVLMGAIVDYLREMDVNPGIVSLINSAGPNDIYYLTDADIEAEDVQVDKYSWRPWSIIASSEGRIAAISSRYDGLAKMEFLCVDGGLYFSLSQVETMPDRETTQADWYRQCKSGSLRSDAEEEGYHDVLGVAVAEKDYHVVEQVGVSAVYFYLRQRPILIEEPQLYADRKNYSGACTDRGGYLVGTTAGMKENFAAVLRSCGAQ